MGFPIACTELLLPCFLLQFLSFLTLIPKLISTLFCYLGVSHFLQPGVPRPDTPLPESNLQIEILAREILPVLRFSDLIPPGSHKEGLDCCCSVCLYDFVREDEIRRLPKCRHIFHRSCMDRWMMGYHQTTCPLCRTPFVPDDKHPRFRAESEISQLFFGESFQN